VLVTPNPFSPHNHLIGKACDITFNLPYDRSVVSLNLYDQSGNIITKILESQYSGSSGVYEWNGADQNGKLLQTGAYILYIEAKDRNSGETYSDKLLVVIGNN
jgi:flagellar hook assembly protein FlgD